LAHFFSKRSRKPALSGDCEAIEVEWGSAFRPDSAEKRENIYAGCYRGIDDPRGHIEQFIDRRLSQNQSDCIP
jgi:hypothetical protein